MAARLNPDTGELVVADLQRPTVLDEASDAQGVAAQRRRLGGQLAVLGELMPDVYRDGEL